MYLHELKKINNIAILWFWREGKSTLNFLLRLWIPEAEITLLDKNQIEIENTNINIVSGDKYLDNLSDFNLIFKSPGISPYYEKIIQFKDKLTSQTEIFFDNYEWKTIWITATKWKSTISSLLYESLKNVNYNVKLVWNIGKPVFDEIDLLDHQDYNYVIYELSSYMLETCTPKCSIWVLWNIFTCHLDWHNNDFTVYENAKLNILKKSDNKIISSQFSQYWLDRENVRYFWINSQYSYKDNFFYKNNQELFSDENILLLWEHNKKNISCVIAILDTIVDKYNHWSAWIFSKLLNWLIETLKTFSWLPHRIEKVADINNIIFIDDGISTTPESTIEAIKTFWNNIDTLFLWGWDYWFTKDSYSLLKKAISEYEIKNIVLFPDTWLDIFDITRWEKDNWDVFSLIINDFNVNIIYTTSMNTAVKFAYKHTWTWKICLMSCAAPSYSLWSWYEEKWQQFLKYIHENKKENL